MAPAPDRRSGGVASRRMAERRRRIGFAVVGTMLVVGVLTLLQVVVPSDGVQQRMAQKGQTSVR